MTMMKRYLILLTVLLPVCLSAQEKDSLRVDLGFGRVLSSSAAAVSTLDGDALYGSTQTQALNALYGMIPGLQVFQNGSGFWPDDNTPVLHVRGNGSYSGSHVLVLVDGIPRDASDIDVNEVASVSVLKDAAALAMYGVRGADGAVLITTRRGGDQPFRLRAGYRFGLQTPTGVPAMASPVEFAQALNEARAADGLTPAYSASDIASVADGTNTLIPTADWQALMLRRIGFAHDAHLSIDGSTKATRYYVYADYRSNRGFLRNTRLTPDLNTQAEYYSLKLRSNLDIDITRYTKLIIGLSARLQQEQGPQSGLDLTKMYAAPTLGIPVQYKGSWTRTTLYDNPVGAILGTGNNIRFGRSLSGDVAIRQSFGMWVPGLGAEVRIAYDNAATISDRKSFEYTWLALTPRYDASGNISDYALSQFGNDTEIAFATWLNSQYMRLTGWARIFWDGSFSGHNIHTALIASRDARKLSGAGNSFKHHDFIFALDYDYQGRYLLNVTLSESASSLLATGDKYRFYPAASLGWVLTREPFMQGIHGIDLLKIRASAGLTGMDANLEYDMDKQFNGAGQSYIFMLPNGLNGSREGDLPSVGIRPETEFKANVGLDFAFPFGLSGSVDGFLNRRSGLRTEAANAVSGVLGIGLSDTFTGAVSGRGVEVALRWQRRFGDWTADLGGNLSFVRTRIDYIEEEYRPDAYQYQQGGSLNRIFALESDGFYQASDFNADGTLRSGLPVATFATGLKPGDVKYKDLNNDGRIDNYDYTWLSTPTVPELYYGFQIGLSWRNIGLQAWFQGTGDWLAVTDLAHIYQPLYGGDKNVSQYYLQNRWTPETPAARYPRLTTLENSNNFRDSDIWTANGRYLKLREVQLWYDLPQAWLRTLHLRQTRVFLRGDNLFSLDGVRIFDPEYISLGYPRARTFSVGVNLQF